MRRVGHFVSLQRDRQCACNSCHPSGDPTPSPDDARLTLRLAQAADILDMPLLDHLIVGDAGRYFSFCETGTLTTRFADGARA